MRAVGVHGGGRSIYNGGSYGGYKGRVIVAGVITLGLVGYGNVIFISCKSGIRSRGLIGYISGVLPFLLYFGDITNGRRLDGEIIMLTRGFIVRGRGLALASYNGDLFFLNFNESLIGAYLTRSCDGDAQEGRSGLFSTILRVKGRLTGLFGSSMVCFSIFVDRH